MSAGERGSCIDIAIDRMVAAATKTFDKQTDSIPGEAAEGEVRRQTQITMTVTKNNLSEEVL